MPALQPSESHFWLCKPNDLDLSVDYMAKLEAVLDDEELARMRRFKFKEHATMFCISHAFTRYVLSCYAPLLPDQWTFRKGEHGKPYVSNIGYTDLYFSLSHTKGLIALYVAQGSEVGCDVERRNSKARGSDIAKRFFSTAEVEQYLAVEPDKQRDRFFDYWSLKESYIKAKGKGLAISLGTFSFSLNERPITFTTDQVLQEQDDKWTFTLLDVGEQHSAAIASQQNKPHLRHWLAQPLLSFQSVELPLR
ncbi:MAG: 4'-phosphopantetheinyl transferase superfamily protein [Pseudomonadales bacterium]